MATSSWLKLCRGVTSRIYLFEQSLISRFTPLALNYDIPYQGCNTQTGSLEETTKNEGFLWMAAPKQKTTPSKKKLRHRHKWLKNRTDIELCVVCGNHKLVGHLCGHCLEKVNQETREHRKNDREDEKHWPIPEILKKFRLY